MQFSLKLVAAAAFLLPSLISSAALPYDNLARRDGSLATRSPEFNALELTRREAEATLEAASVKREAFAQALEDYEEFTTRSLVARTTEAEADAVHKAYKAAQAAQSGLKAKYTMEKDWATKLSIATTALNAATQEKDGRAKFQTMINELKRPADMIAKHQQQLNEINTCVTKWQERKDSAAKKAPSSSGGGGGGGGC